MVGKYCEPSQRPKTLIGMPLTFEYQFVFLTSLSALNFINHFYRWRLPEAIIRVVTWACSFATTIEARVVLEVPAEPVTHGFPGRI